MISGVRRATGKLRWHGTLPRKKKDKKELKRTQRSGTQENNNDNRI